MGVSGRGLRLGMRFGLGRRIDRIRREEEVKKQGR
jgi:hypothetical protein